MRIFLVSLVVIFGAAIGVNLINSFSNLQDAKLQRICKQLPHGASYDEMCREFR
jgi:hypothetical protein